MGLVSTATIGVVDYFAGDPPSIDAIQTSSLSQTTRIFDRNGNLIEALYHENRTVVPLSRISVRLQRATIDTEDRTFYANSGVDYRPGSARLPCSSARTSAFRCGSRSSRSTTRTIHGRRCGCSRPAW